jgi:tRNA pseudouridine55 synthase
VTGRSGFWSDRAPTAGQPNCRAEAGVLGLAPAVMNVLATPPTFDGILVINKPPGLTSHDVVNRVRRLTNQRRVGHAGTLDPLATGVLVVCLGQATRVAEYASGDDKAYCAEIVLGIATDTYDSDGRVTSRTAVDASLGDVQSALAGFLGPILQAPPAYSAIKQGGEPLYKAARAGLDVETEARPVRIDALRIVAYQAPVLVLQVDCGKGTYIRSLAYDLGQLLGCGAHLSALVRLRSGRFRLEDAITLDDLALAVQFGYLDRFLYAPDETVLDHPAVILGSERATSIRQGKGLAMAAAPCADSKPVLCRAYDLAGEFLALGQLDRQAGWWQPHKVFKPCN